MSRPGRGRRAVVAATLVIGLGAPVALRATGWMQMHFSGKSCVGKSSFLSIDDDAGGGGILNTAAGGSTTVHCPLTTSSALTTSTSDPSLEQTLLKMGLVYTASGTGLACTGMMTQYLKASGGGVTSPNLWSISATGTSTTPDYLTLAVPGNVGHLIAGGDGQQAEIKCTMPGTDALGNKTRILAYSVAYQQQ
jgi:hypothetical protein